MFEAEQAAALTLQRSLLPPSMPEVEGLTLVARYLPSRDAAQVGGDWYDAFTLDAYMQASGIHELATSVHAVYDPASRILTVARAGHLAPLLVTAHAEASYLQSPAAPPLGFGLIDLEPCPGELCVRLEPGASVVFFTDGLVERRDESLEVELARLATAAAAQRARHPEVRCEDVVDAVAGTCVSDDIALLVLSIAP